MITPTPARHRSNPIKQIGIVYERQIAKHKCILLPQYNPSTPEQNNRPSTPHLPIPSGPKRIGELQELPRLNMENPQPLLLPSSAVIHILHPQPPRRIIQHPPYLPPRIIVEIARRRLRLLRIRRPHNMEIHPSISRHRGITFGRFLHGVQLCRPADRGVRLRLRRQGSRGSLRFVLPPGTDPGEHRAEGFRIRALARRAGAYRRDFGAVVFLFQSVFETVLPIAVRASNARVL